ncbi:hypothetical protein H845_3317 (plasmid) [Komagataeibacter xylinus E25]|nr:hypothetical protein H845_3317 [Komagataeibacter xylinus E25]
MQASLLAYPDFFQAFTTRPSREVLRTGEKPSSSSIASRSSLTVSAIRPLKTNSGTDFFCGCRPLCKSFLTHIDV